MGGRFSLLSGVAWIVSIASILLAGYGLILFASGGSSDPANPFREAQSTAQTIVAIQLISYGLLGILTSGSVQVLIAIYDKIEAAAGKLFQPEPHEQGAPQHVVTM